MPSRCDGRMDPCTSCSWRTTASIAVSLVDGLIDAGYTSSVVATGAAALAAAPADLVLLDLGLPDMDGRDVCRTLRSRSRGADHHAHGARRRVRPRARSRARRRRLRHQAVQLPRAGGPHPRPSPTHAATGRRGRPATPAPSPPDPSADAGGIQRIGPLEIDRRTRRVPPRRRRGHADGKEFDLLALPGHRRRARCCTRTDILEHVWDAHWYGPTKTVDAHVAALRRKLGDHTLDRGRARRGVPAGTADVRWRLVAVLVGITAAVLAVHDVPLAAHLRGVERDRLDHRAASASVHARRTSARRRSSTGIGRGRRRPAAARRRLPGLAAAARVIVTDRTGRAVVELRRGVGRRRRLLAPVPRSPRPSAGATATGERALRHARHRPGLRRRAGAVGRDDRRRRAHHVPDVGGRRARVETACAGSGRGRSSRC